jgi:hypothetical protein
MSILTLVVNSEISHDHPIQAARGEELFTQLLNRTARFVAVRMDKMAPLDRIVENHNQRSLPGDRFVAIRDVNQRRYKGFAVGRVVVFGRGGDATGTLSS